MSNKYFCKITINRNEHINWNINFLSGQYHLKNMINKYVVDNDIILIKSTSVIINCKIETEKILKINEYIKYCKNEIVNNLNSTLNTNNIGENFYKVILEIYDDIFLLTETNIELFDFVECLIINKNTNIKFNLFKNIKKVTLGIEPSKQLIENLPLNLIELKYYNKSNTPIQILPLNLNTLILGNFYNSYLNVSEYNLKKIIFSNIYSQPVDNLPNTIKILKFGLSFNHPVDNLPWNTEELYFGKKFNHSVDNLPSSLKIISFDKEFNQPINNLPYGLKKIIFTSSYDKYCKFNQSLDNLPDSIESILLLNEKYNKVIKKLPKSLKNITILLKYAYTTNKTTKNINKVDIKNVLKKRMIDCEILISSN